MHEPAWPGSTDEKIALARNPLSPRTLLRIGRAWIRLARAYRAAPPHDVVLVGTSATSTCSWRGCSRAATRSSST